MLKVLIVSYHSNNKRFMFVLKKICLRKQDMYPTIFSRHVSCSLDNWTISQLDGATIHCMEADDCVHNIL